MYIYIKWDGRFNIIRDGDGYPVVSLDNTILNGLSNIIIYPLGDKGIDLSNSDLISTLDRDYFISFRCPPSTHLIVNPQGDIESIMSSINNTYGLDTYTENKIRGIIIGVISEIREFNIKTIINYSN